MPDFLDCSSVPYTLLPGSYLVVGSVENAAIR